MNHDDNSLRKKSLYTVYLLGWGKAILFCAWLMDLGNAMKTEYMHIDEKQRIVDGFFLTALWGGYKRLYETVLKTLTDT